MHMSKRPLAARPDPLPLPAWDAPAPILPCPVAAAVLERGVAERRFLFPDTGPARRVERWTPPALRSQDEATAVVRRLLALDDALLPAHRGALLARVLALLSHYRMDPHPPEVEQRLADDWAEDLGGYPLWAVDGAARTWRRTRRFKPQPAEMVALCEDACSALRQERDRLRQVTEDRAAGRNPLSQGVAVLARGLLRPML